MATTAGRRDGVKRQDSKAGVEREDLDAKEQAGEIVRDQIEELARQGAREMLMAALLDERDAYLWAVALTSAPARRSAAAVCHTR